MNYVVNVNFRSNRDFSTKNKQLIIDALGGKYKVPLSSLNDMDGKNVRTFSFPTKELADNFAHRIFLTGSHIFNIETSEPIQ